MSFKRFFNCPEFSDCTLEIIEENTENGIVEIEKIDDSLNYEPVLKKVKVKEENADVADSNEDNVVTCQKSISCLYIHSLLFCSKSEYFQNILSKKYEENKNIKIVIQANETDHFLKLIQIIYDDSHIKQMSLVETTHVVKLANQFKCYELQKELLKHLSQFKVEAQEIFEEHIKIFNSLFLNNEHALCWKKNLVKYLKQKFCPMEKVFGYLLNDFLNLNYSSLLFFLEGIKNGIAVSEETVLALVIHWLKKSKFTSDLSAMAVLELLENCYFEHVNSNYILNVFKTFIQTQNDDKFTNFYIKLLESKSTLDFPLYFPRSDHRSSRCLHYAQDHKCILNFKPAPKRKMKSIVIKEPIDSFQFDLYFKSNDNVFVYSQGYRLQFNARIFVNDNSKKELQIQLNIDNVERIPHSVLHFLMYYSIASPSVSHEFSPWNQCLFTVKPTELKTWNRISLIAEHSFIHEAGFYLKFNMM